MKTYLLLGMVHPARAQVSLENSFMSQHLTSGRAVKVVIKIQLNQIAVWIETEHEWDVYDLRNLAKTVVTNELAIVGFIRGYAYDVEIARIVNPVDDLDAVLGIDIPCLVERNKDLNVEQRFREIHAKATGEHGVLLHRCLADLSAAMQHADDTGFYCYRAIEALRQHCARTHGIGLDKKSEQWSRFHQVAGTTEEAVRHLKDAADATRHGDVVPITSDERKDLFLKTWDIVDAYLSGI